MIIPDAPHPEIAYRGYSLQLLFTAPQWRVIIAPALQDMPELAPEKRIVRGWNEDEILKRAKVRVDEIMESRHS